MLNMSLAFYCRVQMHFLRVWPNLCVLYGAKNVVFALLNIYIRIMRQLT